MLCKKQSSEVNGTILREKEYTQRSPENYAATEFAEKIMLYACPLGLEYLIFIEESIASAPSNWKVY